MARPASQPAPVPEPDEDDDFDPSAAAPVPPKAPERHPVTPSGTQVPSRKGSRDGTKEPARQGAGETETKGDQVEALKAPVLAHDPYEGRPKLGARIARDLKRQLKIASANHERTEESIVEEAIEQWLERNP
jgi:hypothetical protein